VFGIFSSTDAAYGKPDRAPVPEAVTNRCTGDPAVLIADSEKIRRELGWKPRYEDLRTIVETA
jgi:UDP-glucose 4-epimerase